MNTAGIREGDIIQCDIRGDRFYAIARSAPAKGVVPIESLTGRPIPSMNATSRQVVAHWRKSKQSKA